MPQQDDRQPRPWYESDGTRSARNPAAPRTRPLAGRDPTLAVDGAAMRPYRFDLEPSRPRYLAGRLVVVLGAGGWIVSLLIALAFSGLMDSGAAVGSLAVAFVLGFVAALVMTFAGILMSLAMIIAIIMDTAVRAGRWLTDLTDRADIERRAPTIDLDADPADRNQWRNR